MLLWLSRFYLSSKQKANTAESVSCERSEKERVQF